jgi:hypothetical protein
MRRRGATALPTRLCGMDHLLAAIVCGSGARCLKVLFSATAGVLARLFTAGIAAASEDATPLDAVEHGLETAAVAGDTGVLAFNEG